MATLGSLIIDVAGHEITAEDREILAHPLVGGVIFFSRNYVDPKQLKQLTKQIRTARRMPTLIMVDQEGGRVQRFKEGFTILPSMAGYGELYATDPSKARLQAQQHGQTMAAELLAMGIDLSLAPVLDLNRALNDVIGDRAFHADPAVVVELAQAFITGMNQAGMTACAKHFPGHGGVNADSHVSMPVDNRAFDVITQTDLLPFTSLIKAGISAIMAAHITFPAIDAQPAGFSRIWLQDILRQQLGFKGTIFTDDLNMAGAAISMNYADRVIAAREAGCDFALLCNNRNGVIQAIDEVQHAQHQVKEEKWHALLGDFSRMTIS